MSSFNAVPLYSISSIVCALIVACVAQFTTSEELNDVIIVDNNVVKNKGIGELGNVPTFVNSHEIGDSAVPLSSLATTSATASAISTAAGTRVLKTGDTMSGTLSMGSNAISSS